MLYKSSILHVLDQGDLFYVGTNQQLLCSLQTLQNNCLRIVYCRRNWPGVNQAHIESQLLYLTHRRNCHLLKRAHQKAFVHSNLKDSARQTLTCEYGKSYIVKSIRLWNRLPEEIKLIPDLEHCKIRVKGEMLLNNLNFPE